MSLFNLDRFRFEKSASPPVKQEQRADSTSPESEKENKPAKMLPAKSSSKPSAEGVVFLDTDSDENDDIVFVSEVASPNSKNSSTKKSKHLCNGTGKDHKESGHEEKINKLLAMFPQLTRSQVQEVIESTSTLDGAVAACLLRFGDKDRGVKRKIEASSSSQGGGGEAPPTKKTKPPLDEDLEDWEKHEAMVKRLQRKFPDQDKEVDNNILVEGANGKHLTRETEW